MTDKAYQNYNEKTEKEKALSKRLHVIYQETYRRENQTNNPKTKSKICTKKKLEKQEKLRIKKIPKKLQIVPKSEWKSKHILVMGIFSFGDCMYKFSLIIFHSRISLGES
jgi:hypothetical protein